MGKFNFNNIKDNDGIVSTSEAFKGAKEAIERVSVIEDESIVEYVTLEQLNIALEAMKTSIIDELMKQINPSIKDKLEYMQYRIYKSIEAMDKVNFGKLEDLIEIKNKGGN